MKSMWRFLVLFGVGLLAATSGQAQELRVLDSVVDPQPSLMLRSYLQRIASQQLEERREVFSGIRTRTQFEERRTFVKRQLLEMIGGLPEERTPLATREIGTLDRGDYRLEKIVYESLPNFYVTANLYIPQTGSTPYPAILQPVGHSLTGKARVFYQSLSIGLVKHGFVVLTYDPIGQGERRIFFDPELGDSKVGRSSTMEHQMVGIQSLLAGESVAKYRIWDGIRGIDLLQSRISFLAVLERIR